MKKMIQKGLVVLSIYLIFVCYLFVVSARIERLEHEEEQQEIVNVSFNYGE